MCIIFLHHFTNGICIIKPLLILGDFYFFTVLFVALHVIALAYTSDIRVAMDIQTQRGIY